MIIDRRSFFLGSAATLAVTAAGCGTGATLPPAIARRIKVSGLSAPVEIVEDTYGVPHIRGATIPDAFFGQGYVVARDRLFQIDLSHRREMGRLAEAYRRGLREARCGRAAVPLSRRPRCRTGAGAGECVGLRTRLCCRGQCADRRGDGGPHVAAAGIPHPRCSPAEVGRARYGAARAASRAGTPTTKCGARAWPRLACSISTRSSRRFGRHGR